MATLEKIVVPEELADARLDVVVYQLVEEIPSRSFAARYIDAGHVRYGHKACKASTRVSAGTEVVIDLEPLLATPVEVPTAEALPLNIIFEDEDILVVNKDAGMVVHPGAGVSAGTLVNAVLAHCGVTLPTLGEPSRAGIVHRLDRDTSGVMVVAKSQRALTSLSQQFASHTKSRIYKALVFGTPSPTEGTIETFHGRDPAHRIRYAVVEESRGKRARLDYRTVATFANGHISLVECKLHTGRTHQIRVQMEHIKCPLLGDLLYGKIPQKTQNQKQFWAALKPLLVRQMLHAESLGFEHPVSGELVTFSAPPPTDFEKVLSFLATAKVS